MCIPVHLSSMLSLEGTYCLEQYCLIFLIVVHIIGTHKELQRHGWMNTRNTTTTLDLQPREDHSESESVTPYSDTHCITVGGVWWTRLPLY